eukprot:SAG31_NODE_4280_length_3383_cov_3.430268_3_plen_166_part_00
MLLEHGATFSSLATVIRETARLFPDSIFHIGTDEIVPSGQCSLDSFKRFEKKLQALVSSLGKRPMAWNDVITRAESAETETIIDCWTSGGSGPSTFTTKNATALGYSAVDSGGGRLYLIYPHPPEVSWFDLASDISQQRRSLLLGGEAVMCVCSCSCFHGNVADF